MSIIANSSMKFRWFVENVASKPIALFCVAAVIPLVGFILSLLTHIDTAFSRSGSVLVSFAIFSVYINHFVKKEHDAIQEITRAIAKFGKTSATIKKNLDPQISDPIKRENAAENAAENMADIFGEGTVQLPILGKIHENIVRIEFFSGFFGTLIWGFGDIPFVSC